MNHAKVVGLRSIETPEGVLFFDRETGLNILVDELKAKCCPAWRKPLYVALAITNHCNRQCRWCYSRSGPAIPVGGYWSKDRVLELVKALDDSGILGLAMGGGEPFAYPHFAELCREIWNETSLDVGATTNGDLVTYDDLETLKGHFGGLRVSVWSESEVDKAARLVGHGIPIGVNAVLFRGGFGQVQRIVEAGVANGLRDFLILSCKPVGRAEPSMVPSQSDIVYLVELIRDYPEASFQADAAIAVALQHSGVKFAQPWVEEGAGKRFVMVTHDGLVKPDSFSAGGVPLDGPSSVMSVYGKLGADQNVAR